MICAYEYSELEAEDLYCEECGALISTDEYIYNDGLCNSCANMETVILDDDRD